MTATGKFTVEVTDEVRFEVGKTYTVELTSDQLWHRGDPEPAADEPTEASEGTQIPES